VFPQLSFCSKLSSAERLCGDLEMSMDMETHSDRSLEDMEVCSFYHGDAFGNVHEGGAFSLSESENSLVDFRRYGNEAEDSGNEEAAKATSEAGQDLPEPDKETQIGQEITMKGLLDPLPAMHLWKMSRAGKLATPEPTEPMRPLFAELEARAYAATSMAERRKSSTLYSEGMSLQKWGIAETPPVRKKNEQASDNLALMLKSYESEDEVAAEPAKEEASNQEANDAALSPVVPANDNQSESGWVPAPRGMQEEADDFWRDIGPDWSMASQFP